MKILIDRFCAFNSSIQRKHMKSALLTAAWNADDWTFEALEAHYKTLVRYLNLEDMGMVLGYGCGTPSLTKHSRFPEQAYHLGKVCVQHIPACVFGIVLFKPDLLQCRKEKLSGAARKEVEH